MNRRKLSVRWKVVKLNSVRASCIPLRVPRVAPKQKNHRPESRPIIRMLQAADVCYARIYHRLSVVAPCRLPRDGPAILVCNHVSGLDPVLIQSACPRLITWMMAREYYEKRGLHWIFRTVGAIPVDRSGRDLAATRAALRALEAGRILGVFPEGRIETTRELLPFQTGVAMMALKTHVPVFPAYLDGSQRNRDMLDAMLRPCVASLAFGPAIDLQPKGVAAHTSLECVTAEIQGAVARLQNIASGPSTRYDGVMRGKKLQDR